MARRRLTPLPADPPPPGPGHAAPAAAGAPIARETGDAAAASALAEVSDAYEAARREGRLAVALPLHAVVADHLIRDRLGTADAEMETLVASLRARGQTTPIEVAERGDGYYGLISGWRRLTALERLHAETGAADFATVRAFVRAPESAAGAYLAMVEENEIRLGLSHFERARIVARAAGEGVYPDTGAALRHLFASASRARRSKIGAFLPLVETLGEALRFPAAIPERLGLRLARAVEADPALAPRLHAALAEAAADGPEAEQAALTRALAPAAGSGPSETASAAGGRPSTGNPPPSGAAAGAPAAGAATGIRLDEESGRVILSGPGVDGAFRARLRAWLAGQGG